MAHADTAPLKVLSAGAVEYIITRLAPGFTATTGVPVSFTFGTIGRVKQRLAAGETADIVIGTTPAILDMQGSETTLAGSSVALGRTLTGICVRRGAALPDISTPDAFKAALLAARSFAYTDPSVGGTSGVYLTGLMKQLGTPAAFASRTSSR